VILDTNGPLWDVSWIEDSMGDWLEADLAANDRFWTIVAMHHPWYVSDTREHYDPIHDFLAPIFEAYGVDLVLTGNDHLYERTYPIKEDALSTVAEGGVIYVTNGEASSSNTYYDFYDPAPDWSAARSNHTNENYDASYTHIYIDNGVMSLITVNDLGEVIDPAGSTDPLAIIDRSGEPGANCLATISGAVYEDNDGDEAISASDTPLADVEIGLSNGMTTTTDISGVYQFDGLLPGSYVITELDPPDYFSVIDAQGANDNLIFLVLKSGDHAVEQLFLDQRFVKIYLPLVISSR